MDVASSGLKQSTAISFQKPIEPAQNFFGNTGAPKPVASDSVYISHAARQMLSAKTPNEKELLMNVQPHNTTYTQHTVSSNAKNAIFGTNCKSDSFESLLASESNSSNKSSISTASPNAPQHFFAAGDSRNSAAISRAFGPHVNEKYASLKQMHLENPGLSLDPPDFMQYSYRGLPEWYAETVSIPTQTTNGLDEEQALALTQEYHETMGKYLSQAFDKLGVDENDWRGHGDILQDPEKSAKLRDEFFQLMNGDQRIREITSLLGIGV